MTSSSLLLLLASAMAILLLATTPLAHSELGSPLPTQGEQGERKLRPWPCCDRCGACTRSIPPLCRCTDMVKSCHPACKDCVRSPLSVDPPLFQCMDLIPNYCKHTCNNAKTFYGF